MSEYIVDDKTCMIRVDSVDKKETSQWKVITDIVTNGRKLPMQKLEEWFVRRKIPADGLTKDQILIAKSIYGMLQITCVATDREKVGVFFRRDKEGPTGQEKITTGYSIMRSWSPRSADAKSIQAAFIKKTGFLSDRFESESFGLGYNDLLESSELTGPGYLFVVHKVICNAYDFPSGEQGATDKKSGEKFIGFFDPEVLYTGKASYQDEPIKFKARMDNLILRSLVTGERKTNVGELAVFNQDSWINGDDNVRFKEFDHLADGDKRIIGQICKLTEKYGPTFCANIIYDALKAGIGITAYMVAQKIGF